MKYILVLLSILNLVLTGAGCGVKIFISDTRLRGPVPTATVQTEQAASQPAAEATTTPSSEELDVIQQVMDDLKGQVGKDLIAQTSFSGRETPNSGPLRGARLEAGDTIRISASRAQQIVLEASEYCVEGGARCSRVWIYGRVKGSTLGAWFPIVIFDYELEK
jgi:hypothetical protein